jgi:hypothetical protein
MHPYRTPPPEEPTSRRVEVRDDRLLAAVLLATGAIPVAIATATGGHFGAAATIGLFLVIFGVVGLIRGR